MSHPARPEPAPATTSRQALPFDANAAAAFFGQRAAGIDSAELDVRDGLRWLAERNLLALDLDARSVGGPRTLAGIGALISLIAEHCLASAFAVWSQRMVIEYVAAAWPGFPRDRYLARLLQVELLGSTALGNGMAHLVTGAPLTVRLERQANQVILHGSVAWASNLVVEPDATLLVLAAVDADGQRSVVAVPLDAPGVRVAPYPRLLALQATRSSSVELEGVRLPDDLVMVSLEACLPRIRPTLLSLQTCFCRGLAKASLDAAGAHLDGVLRVLASERDHLRAELARLDGQLGEHLGHADAQRQPMREIVETRLRAARLAVAATRLELKVRGGRAYQVDHPTNRRLREATFLAIQAPTEAQLEWELAQASSSGPALRVP